jgi:translocation and assembly module TamA
MSVGLFVTGVLFTAALLACAGAVSAAGRIVVVVDGAERELDASLQTTSTRYSAPCNADRWRIARVVRRATDEINSALRAFGHYRSALDESLEFEDDCWQANIRVDPGPRVEIAQRRVVINGPANDDSAFVELMANLPLAVGSPLRHDEYEAIKQRLNSLALERGYLDFALTRNELRVDPAAGTADIAIEAESGARYRFGDIRFAEQQALDEAFVRKLADLEPGTPYTANAITSLDRRLSASGYFDAVSVRARRDQRTDDTVPLEIDLSPARRHAWRFGLGFATDKGPRASARYENRYLNRNGHRLESELRLSPVETGMTADYLIPGRQPRTETFSLGAGVLHQDTDSFDSTRGSLIGRQVLDQDPWVQTRFVELQYESSEVGDEDIHTTLLMPGIAIERLETDNPLRARRGYRINLVVRGAWEALLSSASFIQLRASAKGAYRFGEGGRVIGRIDAGTTPGDPLDELPVSVRFFAGGDNSVRGYKYQSLGPENADGDTTGGRHLLTGSLEYDHPVYGDDIWAAAFVDAGNAFDDDFSVRYSVGVGARWYSPVGRVSLDLAFPDDTSRDDWRIHFGLGVGF